MVDDLPLFSVPLEENPKPDVAPDYPQGATTAEMFLHYHQKNPQVYRLLHRLGLDLLRRGVRKYGVKGLFEVMRWQYARQTGEEEPLKLNNRFPSYYARLLLANDHRFTGFFSFRRMREDFQPPTICHLCGSIIALTTPEQPSVLYTCEGESCHRKS